MDFNNNRVKIISTSGDNGPVEPYIDQLRDQLTANKQLNQQTDVNQLDDNFLLKFLRSRDFDIEVTCRLMCGYFSMRKNHPELFRLPSDGPADINATGLFAFLPHRNVTGELLVICKPGRWDTSKYSVMDAMCASVPFFELATLDNDVQRHGVIEVIDARGFGFSHFIRINPFSAKIGSDLIERSLPVKFKEIHVCYSNRVVMLLWAMIRPLLSEEIKHKIFFHTDDLSQVYTKVPKELLPVSIGGEFDASKLYELSSDRVKDIDGKVTKYWDTYCVRN